MMHITQEQPEALRLAAQTPLAELFDAVPEDIVLGIQGDEPVFKSYTNIPIGKLAKQAAAELRRLHALVNTPELHNFRDGVVLEAVHQRERFDAKHDACKTPEDWFWLVGYLAGRALEHHKEAERLTAMLAKHSHEPNVMIYLGEQIEHHREKAVHHCITSAAACANWHSAVRGKVNMRPGVSPETIIAAAGETA